MENYYVFSHGQLGQVQSFPLRVLQWSVLLVFSDLCEHLCILSKYQLNLIHFPVLFWVFLGWGCWSCLVCLLLNLPSTGGLWIARSRAPNSKYFIHQRSDIMNAQCSTVNENSNQMKQVLHLSLPHCIEKHIFWPINAQKSHQCLQLTAWGAILMLPTASIY